jgi:lipopolysaccharide/colanic/teichoic acid biosynthesis glycosyltransferase
MNTRKLRYVILAADLACVLGALLAAVSLRYYGDVSVADVSTYFKAYWFLTGCALIAWSFLFFEMSLDGFRGGWNFPAILSKLIVAVCLLMVLLLAIAFATNHFYSRLVLLYFALSFLSELVCVRVLVRYWLTSKLRELAEYRCMIVGYGHVAQELAAKIKSHPEIPFRVAGFLFPGEPDASNGLAKSLQPPFTSVTTVQILDLLIEQRITKLIVAMPQPSGPEVQKLIDGCRKAAIQVYLVPQWYDLYVSKAKLIEIDGVPLLSLQEPSHAALRFVLKRAIDILLSAVILLFVSPLLTIAGLIVYSKKRKAFRSEPRCGKGGVTFAMYRLNVDRHGASPGGYERLFVRWSLTELPQLLNVLLGDMSLVGPRPESPERVKYYSEWQRQRLKVQAGVTGLAQVHGIRDQHSSEDKAHFDLQYIFNWSPLWDLSLIVQTVWTVMTRGLRQEPAVLQDLPSQEHSEHFVPGEPLNVNRS